MAVAYEVTLKWHPKPHTTLSVQSADFDNLDDAENAAGWAARKLGYTQPKWWEYWRWKEGRDMPTIVARAKEPPPSSDRKE